MRSSPADAFHVAYCIFFLQGVGQLFPWNVFINAEDYFRRRLCGSSFESYFENAFALAYNFAAIVALILALRYQELWDVRGRIMGSLAVSMLSFVACGILVLVEDIGSALLFFLTLALIVASGLATAVLQGALFAMASAFPPRYTQAMMAGQGLAGLTVALAGLFTTLAGADDQSCTTNGEDSTVDLFLVQSSSDRAKASRSVSLSSCAAYTRDWSSLVYFAIAVAVLVGCMLTYPILERLPLTAFYTRNIHPGDDHLTVDNIVPGSADEDGGSRWLVGGRPAAGSSTNADPSMYRRLVETPPTRLLPSDKPLSDAVVRDKAEAEGPRGDFVAVINGSVEPVGLAGLRSRLEPISRFAFAVFFAFTVTLSVFPGATSEIVSSRRCDQGRSRFFATDVFVMFSFVSFNAFDLLGRLAAGLAVVLPKDLLPTASLLRLGFVPLFLACRSEKSRFRNWLSSDIFPIILMPLFAFTNGYVGSLSMMAGSQKGAWAGTAMVLFLSGGLLAGSLLSFLVLFVNTEP